MGFRRKVFLVLSLGVLVIIVQMFALSYLSSPPSSSPQLPWMDGKEKRGLGGIGTIHPPLQHENPGDIRHVVSSQVIVQRSQPGPSLSSHGIPGNHSSSSTNSSRTVNHTPRQSTAPPTKGVVTTTAEVKESYNALSPVPVPNEAWNCDISNVKDAMSAINRAKSKQCKELIHNLTCLQRAGKLYNTEIQNSCPLKRDPGKGFESIPYELGKGPPVRVVFLLSAHGRALRQVKRLFKAIYHKDHYYFIHVDSRSDYLHRELHKDLSSFPNVYFPTWRLATIWGGASLLQMLLGALQDLELVLHDWQWDYFINLSESDYPIRTNAELGKFLRVHRGKSFVKTHGADLNKFIQKQGLDRTFVECDNHMWRVDSRSLPPAIDVDGGSDWIVIHRNYSRYLVTNKDPFLVDLKRYFQFTLLPAESFFHTVLRNGPLCSTFVKTNLRITNWNRKLGCRCQYKHVVDWCGCSPNDFLTKDFGKLKAPSSHSFFARKFEAIVNQEVILQLDSHLYGPLPPDLPGLTSYWESVYHSEDTLTKCSNARYTAYQSFLRSSRARLQSDIEAKGREAGAECAFPREATVREVSAFTKTDKLQGLVVTIAGSSSLSKLPSEPVFEVLFVPVPHTKKFRSEGDAGKRPWSLEVGSNWDGKESVFRNVGGILGVWDEPVAAVRLAAGHYSELEIQWVDPVGEHVSTFNMKMESGWFVSYHKPKLERPIRPGLWSVKLVTHVKSGKDLLQTDFLVVPLTHENKEPLGSPQSVNALRAGLSGKVGGAGGHGGVALLESWRRNVSKSGVELDGWVDDLLGQYWRVEGSCRGGAIAMGTNGGCGWMPSCAGSGWSTLSPDPKSELGEVQSNGRLR